MCLYATFVFTIEFLNLAEDPILQEIPQKWLDCQRPSATTLYTILCSRLCKSTHPQEREAVPGKRAIMAHGQAKGFRCADFRDGLPATEQAPSLTGKTKPEVMNVVLCQKV